MTSGRTIPERDRKTVRVRLSRAATLDLRAIIKHTERGAPAPVEASEVLDAIVNSEWNRIVNGPWGVGEHITREDDLYWMHEDGTKHEADGPYDCLVCRRLRAGRGTLDVVASRRGKPKAKTKKRSQGSTRKAR